MAQSLINWRRGDYVKLGRAVAEFNRKIDKVRTEENQDYLPEKISYRNLKDNILTRQELNRQINSLKRFQRENASNLYETQASMRLTNWEREELRINERVAKAKQTREINRFNNETKASSGFTREQMGSLELQRMKASRNNLGKLETVVGKEFDRLRRRLRTWGSSDFSMRRSITYRKNYIDTMKKYKSFKNYDKLKAKMDELSNPMDFYDFMSKNELTKDLTYQSDQVYGENEFNNYLISLGIIEEDDLEEYK